MKDVIMLISLLSSILMSCAGKSNSLNDSKTLFSGKEGEVRLIILDPGHFHASLLQKNSMKQVSDTMYVYAPNSSIGLDQYLSAIKSFNQRLDNPTKWKEIVYTGDDFMDKMVSDRLGNVVILAGNNKNKSKNIAAAIDAGINVLSDKPMAINKHDFKKLEEAYNNAEVNNVLLYDIMTERYDMLNIIERELINNQSFFGELEKGTSDNPAVYMESVHHFYKEVSGAPLIRPAWYYDVEQQGEGIADVTTHLIDLLFWKCFPIAAIDYKQDIKEITASHWPTSISLQQFIKSTGELSFPDYLQKYIENSTLQVYSNGCINFDVKGHKVGLKVEWNFQAPDASSDTFMSKIEGTRAILKTVQDKEQGFTKQLYVIKPEKVNADDFLHNLKATIDNIQIEYPFVTVSPTSKEHEFLIDIPIEKRDAHESHFKYVAESFFSYLVTQDIPEWEISNTLAKYYITTQAVEIANE